MSRGLSSQESGKEKRPLLGLIGVGRMGTAMAENFLAAGHPLIVYDTQSEAVESLVNKVSTTLATPGIGLSLQ